VTLTSGSTLTLYYNTSLVFDQAVVGPAGTTSTGLGMPTTITNSTFSGNSAKFGGAIGNFGSQADDEQQHIASAAPRAVTVVGPRFDPQIAAITSPTAIRADSAPAPAPMATQ
jgi:hypothetical protein